MGMTQECASEEAEFEPLCEVKKGIVYKEKTSLPPPKLSLKPLPPRLRYSYLDIDEGSLVIVSSELDDTSLEKLLVLFRSVIRYSLDDIKAISLTLVMHQIHLDDEHFSLIEPQRRLNPNMKEVVKDEILKLLKAGINYSISDSRWVSPVHVVLKKGGMTMIENDKGEMIQPRATTGWRVCIDYRKLNKATRKDHFPLPFIDKMLERLARHKYYCFLDGYSGFFQSPIHPEDQQKKNFHLSFWDLCL